ncbi:MAG: transposase, partial [Gallionellaceae bacterium]
TRAGELIAGLTAENLLADKGYDSDAIIEQAAEQCMKAQIPPRKNRKEQRGYDKELYKLRHLAENAFLHLKQWRGIATRYANAPRHSLRSPIFDASPCGRRSRDDTV